MMNQEKIMLNTIRKHYKEIIAEVNEQFKDETVSKSLLVGKLLGTLSGTINAIENNFEFEDKE
jgi:hypothetical protein